MMARWRSGWPGLPVWWPNGKLTNTALGGFTDSVMSSAEVMEMVGIPDASTALAISPTD